jgi:hypothetical protein
MLRDKGLGAITAVLLRTGEQDDEGIAEGCFCLQRAYRLQNFRYPAAIVSGARGVGYTIKMGSQQNRFGRLAAFQPAEDIFYAHPIHGCILNTGFQSQGGQLRQNVSFGIFISEPTNRGEVVIASMVPMARSAENSFAGAFADKACGGSVRETANRIAARRTRPLRIFLERKPIQNLFNVR